MTSQEVVFYLQEKIDEPTQQQLLDDVDVLNKKVKTTLEKVYKHIPFWIRQKSETIQMYETMSHINFIDNVVISDEKLIFMFNESFIETYDAMKHFFLRVPQVDLSIEKQKKDLKKKLKDYKTIKIKTD